MRKGRDSAEKRLAQSPISRAVSYYCYFHYYHDYLGGPRGNSATCDVGGQGEGR